jgi:cytosine/adenosine deaminase-related metal-dependent hydrolase
VTEEIVLAGTVIAGEEFEPISGYICIKDGIIREIGHGEVDCLMKGIICPRLINAHVHIGDSVIKDPPFMPLSDLVGPGGLKHRILSRADPSSLIEGMRRTLHDMVDTGTCAFIDFREGGSHGADLILKALDGMDLIGQIFGRPVDGELEIDGRCHGLGISSTRDIEISSIREMAGLARARGQSVGIHAGEASTDDISDALDQEPDFLVHLCRASDEDLRAVASSGTPVIICPRSNLVTGSGLPKVKKMIELGITLGVGTDNVMLNSANMLQEMELICKALLHDDRQVFKMCTLNGAKIMGIDRTAGSIDLGKEGRVMVIDDQSNNLWGLASPLAGIVRRARPSDILAVF